MGIFRRKKMDKRLLNQYALQANRHLEIYQDCQNLLLDTLNPAVFFMRYELAIEQLEELNELVKVTNNEIQFKGNLRRQIKNLKNQQAEMYREFISRYHNDSVFRASKLKTDKGQANNYIKSKDKILKEVSYLSSAEISLINNLWGI